MGYQHKFPKVGYYNFNPDYIILGVYYPIKLC